jgi:hypothetical protein
MRFGLAVRRVLKAHWLIVATFALACSETSGGVDFEAECRRMSTEVLLDEATPLGFTGRQFVEKGTVSKSVAFQMGGRPSTRLQIETTHQGDPVFHTPRGAFVPRPGTDGGRICKEGLSTSLLLSLRSEDGAVVLSQAASLSALTLDQLSVTQRLAVLGEGAGLQKSQTLTGKLDIPLTFFEGMDSAVAEIEIKLPSGTGTLIVSGQTATAQARRALPNRLVASWDGS